MDAFIDKSKVIVLNEEVESSGVEVFNVPAHLLLNMLGFNLNNKYVSIVLSAYF